MKILDFIGIGFGPANIALAIQLEENNLSNKLDYLFIESNKDSMWQREMLISGSDIQNIPIRDLITPVNPRSHYTFINYLHKNERFFKYCGLGLKFPLRQEYAMYVNWCASHFKNTVHYDETVENIEISDCGKYYILNTGQGVYCAKIIVVATGRTLYIPSVFNNIPKNVLITTNDFISKTVNLNKEHKYKFALVGASQSAAEIFLELANKFNNATIHSYIRQFSFVLRDSSPFSYGVFLPEFIDEYYHADDNIKLALNSHLRRTNYSSADMEILDNINIKIYEENLNNNFRLEIKRNSAVLDAYYKDNFVWIRSKNAINKKESLIDYDFVITCTGFKDLGRRNKEYLPPLLAKFSSRLVSITNREMTQFISENYEMFFQGGEHPIYLNGLCETSHGMGDAGAFGLVSIRVRRILNSLVDNLNSNLLIRKEIS